MTRLSDIRISRKLFFVSALTALQILLFAGLAVQAMKVADTTAAKAAHYSYKLKVAVGVQASLSELALHISNLPNTRQVEQEVQAVMAARKEYAAGLAYLKENATTDEDRRILNKINEAIIPWRELNNRIMQSVRVGEHIDASHVSQESVARFGAVKSSIAEYLQYRQRRLDFFQEEQQAAVGRFRWWLAGIGVFCVVATLLLNRQIGLSLAIPLGRAAKLMASFADGDLTGKIAAHSLSRKDEIGMLATGTHAMVNGLRALAASMNEGIGVLTSSSAKLAVNAGRMSDGSHEVSENAHSVAAAAEQMTGCMASIAAGMEQTSNTLANVATATEEMTATIREIARNSEKARRITEDATRQAAHISEQMNELGVAAQQIGKVTETITEISSQTNLLALNATIEAARAGSAGKGFAIVANEIKALAQQTAAATEDVKARIAGVQSSSAGGIAEIDKVSQVIREVSEIVSSIAAAIEEQSTVTRNIAGHIGEASGSVREAHQRVAETSHATADIARKIAGVDRAAGQMTVGSEQLQASATEMSSVSEHLQTTVQRFKL